jgi:hypothetical protein
MPFFKNSEQKGKQVLSRELVSVGEGRYKKGCRRMNMVEIFYTQV